MIDIDGYAFIPEYTQQAVPIINDKITYSEIVKRGWCSPAARIIDDPSTYNPSNEHGPWFSNVKEAERAVAGKTAFKYEGRYYLFHGSVSYVQPTNSEYERPYWKKDGGGDRNALDLITSALSAPLLPDTWKPYRFHFMTVGRERVDMVVWERTYQYHTYNVVERTSLPGIGYKYVPDGATHLDDPGESEIDRWSSYALVAAGGSAGFNIYISFPDCVLGPTTCARFVLTLETEKEVIGVDKYGVNILVDKYTSCRLTFQQFVTPKDYRRVPMPRFQPRSATDAVSCYVMNRAEVKQFIDTLYTKDIYDKIKAMLYGDGAGNILSLKWFYGIRPSITTPQRRKITLGNVILEKLNVPVYAGDFKQVYMGNIFVGGKFGDYRDYTNMRIRVFVPMLGDVDLDPAMVVGKLLHLLYTVNLTDGSAVVTISTTERGKDLKYENGWYETTNIVFTTSITYGYEIPLNVESIRTPSLMIGEVAAKAIAGGMAGALVGNVAGAAAGVAAGAAAGLGGAVQSTYSSGALTPNSNVMGDFTPKLIRIFNESVTDGLAEALGRPSGKVIRVVNASGYLKAMSVYGTPSTTMQHADEIVNMLKEGIYIS